MELEKLFKLIFDSGNGERLKFKVTHLLKKEINSLEIISHCLEKVTIPELLELYYSKGGSKKEIELFLKKR